jgi:hypothetical protein
MRKPCRSGHIFDLLKRGMTYIWCCISDILKRDLGVNFDSVGIFWLSNKKFAAVNIVSAATLWGSGN